MECITLLIYLATTFVPIVTTSEATVRSKEKITVITGSKHIARVGTLHAPPNFLAAAYNMNWTAYIFILENVATHGSVQVDLDIFDLHPNSWLTVRKSKYSGYLGRVSHRYNWTHPPTSIILTDTCCLRIEFQTGCCGPAIIAGQSGLREFYGIRAQYEFVPTMYKGRRVECTEDAKYPQLCNGECLPAQFACPCSKFGQFKCANDMCVPPEGLCDGLDDCGDQSDETDCKVINPRRGLVQLFGMYALEPIVISCGTIFLIGFCLACAFSVLDRRTKWFCAVVIETTAKEAGLAPPRKNRCLDLHDKSNESDDATTLGPVTYYASSSQLASTRVIQIVDNDEKNNNKLSKIVTRSHQGVDHPVNIILLKTDKKKSPKITAHYQNGKRSKMTRGHNPIPSSPVIIRRYDEVPTSPTLPNIVDTYDSNLTFSHGNLQFEIIK